VPLFSNRELTTALTTTMTTVGLPDTSAYPTLELVSCLIAPSAVPTDQKVDWQQGGSRQINTTGHSTSLAITSVQLNGTGRPVLVHRISVRDEEVVGTHLPMQPSDVPRGISSVQSLNTERLPASPPVWASPTTRVLPAPLKYRRRYRSRFARPQLLPTRPMSYWQLEPTFPIAIVCSKHNKRPCVRILSPLSFGLQRFAVQRALRPSTPHRNDFHLQLLGLTWPSHHQ